MEAEGVLHFEVDIESTSDEFQRVNLWGTLPLVSVVPHLHFRAGPTAVQSGFYPGKPWLLFFLVRFLVRCIPPHYLSPSTDLSEYFQWDGYVRHSPFPCAQAAPAEVSFHDDLIGAA